MSDGRKVVIFGATDFARIAAFYLDHDSPHEVVAFCVDEAYLPEERELLGRPIVAFETLEETHPPGEHAMLAMIGFSGLNSVREQAYEKCKAKGYEMISYVCSKATTWPDLDIGENTFIFEDNVIQPFVRIGSNVVLWSGNHIGHDATIEDHVFIASHAVVSGHVTIKDHCFVGVNATFRDGVTVAPRCIIGANAVVMKDTQEGDVLAVRHTEPHPKKSWELNF
ncbi:MAG TPA: acetyltransferase [Capillimicrobium sp.]|nr:acetyltransferase [Capillimicrobium sp.]